MICQSCNRIMRECTNGHEIHIYYCDDCKIVHKEPEHATNKWKLISQTQEIGLLDSLHRIHIEGGWLYRTLVLTKDGMTSSMVFVPEKREVF